MGEIRSLTSMRGLAALLVVLYHFRREFGSAVNLDVHTQFFAKAYLWVDFFFILSGFVMALVHAGDFAGTVYPPSRVKPFLIRRLARIYPLHLFTLLCFIPTEFAKLLVASNADPAFSHNSLFAIVTNLLLVQAWHLHPWVTWNHPAWSISAEWAAYLLFPLLLAGLMGLRPRWLPMVVVAAFAGLGWLIYGPGNGHLTDLMQDFGVPRALCSFALGMLIYRLKAQGTGRLQRQLGSSGSLLGALLAIVLAMHLGAPDLAVIALFCWLIAAAALARGGAVRLLEVRPIHYLGVVSYSIYLDHSLIQRAWQLVWQKWGAAHLSVVQCHFMLGLLMALSVAAAALTYRFVEQPGRRLVPRWLGQGRRPAEPPLAGGELLDRNALSQ